MRWRWKRRKVLARRPPAERVLRVDGTWHADGARVGDAQQTWRGHARSSTRKSGVRSQHPRHRPRPTQAQQRTLGVRSGRCALTRSRRRRHARRGPAC
eukprot:5871104-Prymnesium_polylepis.1